MDQNQVASPIFFILAVGRHGEIGTKQSLPWPRLPADMRHFRRVTEETTAESTKNAVVMGWKTWVSIGMKPLRNRINVVLTTRQPPDHEVDGVIFVDSVDQCYKAIDQLADVIEKAFVIGGKETFDAFFADDHQRKRIYGAHITYIDDEFPEADVRVDVSLFEQRFPVVVDESLFGNLRFIFRQ